MKFRVRIEQWIAEAAFEIIEAETAAEAMKKAETSGGPYKTGDGFEFDGSAGITERDIVSAEPVPEESEL